MYPAEPGRQPGGLTTNPVRGPGTTPVIEVRASGCIGHRSPASIARAVFAGREVSSGDTVLIVGPGGGAGNCAVQLAVAAGVTMIAPALPEDESHVWSR
jgi:hypothetical protein